MYYIPMIDKNCFELSNSEVIIRESQSFKDFFKILVKTEKITFIKKETLLQYDYTINQGIFKEPIFSITVDKEGHIRESLCHICSTKKQCHHRYQIAQDIKNELEPNLKNKEWIRNREKYILDKIDEEKNRINEEKLLLKRYKSLDTISNLLTTIKSQDSLPLLQKVKLEPILNFILYQSRTICHLELKIGIDKMYILSNIPNFFELIHNKDEYTYGKNLSFKHMLSNFDTLSQHLITTLINYKSNKGYYDIYSMNNKEMKIDLKVVEDIFTIYQNKDIQLNFNDKFVSGLYNISLNPVQVGFKLNKNYCLDVININDKNILDCPTRSFVIGNYQINLLSYANEKMKPLYKFIKDNPNFNFKLIKDVLSKEILARYYKNIEIDDSIKNVIKINELTIESYFKYENDKIKLISKFLLDEQVINIDQVDSSTIEMKIQNYNLILENLGFEKNEISEPSKVFQFFKTDLSSLKELSTVFLSENIIQMQTNSYKPFRMNLSYQTGMLSVCFEDNPYTDEELLKIIRGLRKRTKYIKLKKDVILEVDDNDAERLLNTIDEFNLDVSHLLKQHEVPLFQALKINHSSLNIIDFDKTKQLEELLEDISNYKNAEFSVPNELESVLRSYQKEAYLWMKTLIKYDFCGILADDMGLGKTLEMISVILSDKTNSPSLIVCPKSLCYNWKNEFELWSPNLTVANIIGSSNDRKNIISNIKTDERRIYITSYDSLKNDLEFYDGKKFHFMVLDEAQYIKNHDTLKAQSVKIIDSKHRFVLTGTPIENSVVDLWSIFDFLMPGYLNNYSSFKSKYERSIIEKKDSNTINSLLHKISPFILRRKKEDVITDLPEKIETIQVAKMTVEQNKIYNAELKRTRNILEEYDNKIEILACLTRLRQICVDPGMYIENYGGGSGKVSLAMELINDYLNEGHRILLFSQFTTIFSKIEVELKKRKIKYYQLTGKTSAEDRVMMATDFNENDDTKVFLISLKAGGTGLNLVGADIVIHLDPWWNVAAENQATDRAHRIGQTKVVQVIKLISEDSIEQKVIELQERKKEIVKMIVADDDSNIRKLSKDDINFLLDNNNE